MLAASAGAGDSLALPAIQGTYDHLTKNHMDVTSGHFHFQSLSVCCILFDPLCCSERSRTSEIREEASSALVTPADWQPSASLDEGDGRLPEPTLAADQLPRPEAAAAGDSAELREVSGRKRGSRPPPLSIEIAQADAGAAVKVEEPEADDTLEPTEVLLEKYAASQHSSCYMNFAFGFSSFLSNYLLSR